MIICTKFCPFFVVLIDENKEDTEDVQDQTYFWVQC